MRITEGSAYFFDLSVSKLANKRTKENMNIMLIHGTYCNVDPHSNNMGFRIKYEVILGNMHTFWF